MFNGVTNHHLRNLSGRFIENETEVVLKPPTQSICKLSSHAAITFDRRLCDGSEALGLSKTWTSDGKTAASIYN